MSKPSADIGSSDSLKHLENESVNTEQASIDYFSTGYDYTIFTDGTDIYAVNRKGELKYGGPNNLNVTDATDFAEIFATIVNSESEHQSIKLAGGDYVDSYGTTYKIKTSGYTLDNVFHLFGPGKNSANIGTTTAVEGDTIFTMNAPSTSDILAIYSTKFCAIDRTKPVSTYFDLTDVNEIVFTDSEFRDVKSADNGIKISGSVGYNYIRECWFLTGCDVSISNSNDFIIANNNIRATISVTDSGPISENNNVFLDGGEITYSGCYFEESLFKGPLIEDFEQETISHYRDITDTDNFEFSSTSIHGSKALKGKDSEEGANDIGYPYKLRRGEKLILFYYPRGSSIELKNTQLNTSKTAQFNSGDFYGFKVVQDDNTIEINRGDDGTKTTLASASPTINSDTWYKVVIEYGIKNLKLTLYDLSGTELGSCNADDRNYTDDLWITQTVKTFNTTSGGIVDYLRRDII